MDAILNISISPMMPRWHHSVSMYVHIGEHIYAKTFCADYFGGLHPKSSFGYPTKVLCPEYIVSNAERSTSELCGIMLNGYMCGPKTKAITHLYLLTDCLRTPNFNIKVLIKIIYVQQTFKDKQHRNKKKPTMFRNVLYIVKRIERPL